MLLISLFCTMIGIDYSNDAGPEGCQTGYDDLSSGPYIFNEGKNMSAKWVEKGVYKKKTFNEKNYHEIEELFNLKAEYKDLRRVFNIYPDCSNNFKNVDSVAIVSDLHGEYEIYLDLLRNNGIVDKNLDWNFGTGHLVVLGDVFDRGDKVVEILWHLFALEKQAEAAGGKLHLILGNHEIMVLSNDLRYINDKYNKVWKLTGITYYELYSEKSVLGKWLRTKPVAVSIDDVVFIHAGISAEMAERRINLNTINKLFSDSIVGRDMEQVCRNEELFFLSDSKGPVWFRGYFADSSYCENKLDQILKFYKKKHIVVGHTPHPRINQYFNYRVIGADSGIGHDQPGEMLIYKNNTFYRGFCTRSRVKL